MLRRGALPLVLILLASSFLAIPLEFPQAHAAPLTGKVCLADPSALTASNPCPSSPPLFDGPKGQQIRIGVFINGSDALNVFEVTLLTNHTILKPVGIDLANSVLAIGAPAVIVGECIQGIVVAGGACINNDTIDTLSLAAGAPPGLVTPPNVSGLLFTAIYNITGTTLSGSPISIRYNPGCGAFNTKTSVAGGFCITISNGQTLDLETSQGASFDNSASASLPDVVLSASPSSFGPQLPGSNTATITASAVNGYPGTATDGVTFTNVASPGLSASIGGTNPCLVAMTSCSVTLSLTTTSAGNYFVTVFGTYATADASGNPDTLVASVTLSVVVDDFSIIVSPTTVKFTGGGTGTATVTLASLNGFAGTVTLASGTSTPAGLTITFSQNPVALTSTGPGSSQGVPATFSANPGLATTYHDVIKATSGTRTRSSVLLSAVVSIGPDFAIAASPTTVSANVGVAASSTITVTPLHSFTGIVTLTNTTSLSALSCNLAPSSLTNSGTSTLSCKGSTAGTYTANVTGTSGSLSHSVIVTFTVTVPSPDYTLSASPAAATVKTKIVATSTISVNATNGFTGTITLASSVVGGNGLICSLSSFTVVLGTSGTSTLMCSGSPGAYTVTVTGSNSTTNSRSTTFSVTVQDFTLTASPSSLSVNATATGTSTIIVAPQQGFSDPVTLGFTVLPGTGLTCGLSSLTVSGGSGNSLLSCSGSASSYAVNVTGTSGPLSHSVIVNLTVQDFTISANPTNISFNTNGSSKSTVTIASLSGFSATVTLSAKASDPSVSWIFTSNSITGGSGSSTLTISGSTNGMFSLNVTGVSGPLTHIVRISVQVSAGPDFSLSASPSNVNVDLGSIANSTIIITPLLGFTGTITLTNSSSSQALSCSLSQTTIVLGAAASSKLSCHGTVGVYTVKVSGYNGTVTRSVNVIVSIQDFMLSSLPSVITLYVGVAGSSVIMISSPNGFAGTVDLSFSTSSPDLSCGLSQTSILSGSGTSTLSCSSSVSANYQATVTGVNGTLSHSALVMFQIQDFSIAASQPAAPVDARVAATSTITVAPLNGFAGTVNLTDSTNSTRLTCNFSSLAIAGGTGTSTLSCTSNTAGNYSVTVTGTSGSLAHSTGQILIAVLDFSITSNPSSIGPVFAEAGANSTIIISALNGFSGTVTLTFDSPSEVTSTLNATMIVNHGAVLLKVTGMNYGNFLVNITATSGLLSHTITVMVVVVEFSPIWSPTSINVSEASSVSVQLSVSSLNGFAGPVAFSYVPIMLSGTLVSGLSATFADPSLTIAANGSSSTMVTISVAHNLPTGFYGINLTVTSGSHALSKLLPVQVPPSTFSIVAAGTATIGPAVVGTSKITISPSGGLTGLVNVTAHSPSTALTCLVSPSSVGPVETGSNTTLLSCQGSPGSYNVTITGMGKTPFPQIITIHGYVLVVVADFSVTPNPTGVSVVAGQTGHAQIKISWTNNYNGVVNLVATSSNGLEVTLDSQSLTGPGTATLNVVSNSAGTYTVVVNATSGSDHHSASLTVTVLAPAGTSNLLGLDPAVLYSLVGIAIVAALAAIVLVSRRGRRVKRAKR